MSPPVFPPDDSEKTLVETRDRSATVSSDVSIPRRSFSPCVMIRRPHLTANLLGVKVNVTDLTVLRPTSPKSLSEDPTSKMESPILLPARPNSCPIPSLAPPMRANKMTSQPISFSSSSRPSSPRIPRLSKSSGLTPYAFPKFQPQPDPSMLPAATRTPPKPTYLKTARDRTTAIYGPLHPVIDCPRPPPPPNPQDIQVQRARFMAGPIITASSPLQLVYDTRSRVFSLKRRSVLLPSQSADTPMIEMDENLPPLLVDGRMTIVNIPRWRKTLVFFWRSCDGKKTKVWRIEVGLPAWVWMARNFGKKEWKECFVKGF